MQFTNSYLWDWDSFHLLCVSDIIHFFRKFIFLIIKNMFEACTLIDVSIVYTILSYWFDYEDILYKLLNLNSSYYVFFFLQIFI